MLARRLIVACLISACVLEADAFQFGSPACPAKARKPLAKSTRALPRASSAPATASAATHWGVLGVMSILANAIGRLAPIAVEPLRRGGLAPVHWAAYAAAVIGMAYVEGYKAFQLKFSPLVVSRAFSLGKEGGHNSFFRGLLAPFYSMGLFHATRKRKIVSWTVSLAVVCVVAAVKRLSYPWRAIVDAGVVAGLTWGATSIGWIYAKALRGTLPEASAELPPQ